MLAPVVHVVSAVLLERDNAGPIPDDQRLIPPLVQKKAIFACLATDVKQNAFTLVARPGHMQGRSPVV